MSKISTIVLLICILFAAQGAFAGECYWVGTWATGQQLTEPHNNPPAPGLANNTLRQVVHATIGGKTLRVQFSNAYGDGPVTLNAVHIAKTTGSNANSAIDTATDKVLTFQHTPSVTIEAGESVYADPICFPLTALSNVTVTMYFGNVPAAVTGHPGSRTTSYIQPGNDVSAADMTSAAASTAHWYYLSKIDVLADASYADVVVLGDSISDGRGSITNENNRWVDNLARRLQADPGTDKIGVINMGIGGNTVLTGGLGPTALTRYDHDVLAQSGVRWVLIMEGVNDIGGSSNQAVATDLIGAYEQFIDKAHAHNILAYGIPILPFAGSQYDTADHEAARQTVNNWIRTSGRFDAVIDLDAVVRNPANPLTLLPDYDTGDHLHLNVLGYQKMAEAIDLALFRNSKLGDVDGNSLVNVVDAVLIIKYAMGKNPSGFNAAVADVTGDGKIDIRDALRVVRMSAGLK